MPTLYIYNPGSKNAAKSQQPVNKGAADENDPTVFEWADDNGNILGWAKEDGTKNEFGSYVEAITNEQQFRMVENQLFELRVASQCCHSGINTLTLLKEKNWQGEVKRLERAQNIHLSEIVDLEMARLSILSEIFQEDMKKILGAFYADVRGSLQWSLEEAAEMGEVLDDEKEKITARGIELFESGSADIDFESAYNVLVPMYVSMSAMQRLKANVTEWKTIEG